MSEADARAHDGRHLPGQQRVSAALFGGLGQVASARAVAAGAA